MNCRTCGACCISPPAEIDDYVYVDNPSLERLKRAGKSPLARLSPVFGDGDYYLLTKRKSQNGLAFRTCIAFEGEIGKNCLCSIYGIRPTVCRVFSKGSRLCLQAREEVEELGISLQVEEEPSQAQTPCQMQSTASC